MTDYKHVQAHMHMNVSPPQVDHVITSPNQSMLVLVHIQLLCSLPEESFPILALMQAYYHSRMR